MSRPAKSVGIRLLRPRSDLATPSADGWGSFPSPLVVGGLLITHLSGRGIVALDRANGEIAWETPVGITHYFSGPVMADGLIVSGVGFGQLAALDPESGAIVWQGEVLDAQYPTQILVEGERMYVATNQGRVRCLGLSPREAFWSVQAGSDLLDMNPFRRGVRSMWAAPARYRDLLVVGGIDGPALHGEHRDRRRCVAHRLPRADQRRPGRGRRPARRSDVGRTAVGVRDRIRLRYGVPYPLIVPWQTRTPAILSSC